MLPSGSATFNTPNPSGNARVYNIYGNYNAKPDQLASAAEAKEIYRWLGAPDSSSNYYAARKKHHMQTGAWFIEGTQFEDWKSEPGSALWINGTPSATLESSSVVEDVVRLCAKNPNHAYAYFFLDNRNPQTGLSSHDGVIRSLIEQLCDQLPDIPAPLVNIYGRGHRQPSTVSLQLALQQIIEEFEHVYIILDALDECVDRESLLDWICDLEQQKSGKLHMMLTSRKEPDIKESLDSMNPIHVTLAGKFVHADIATYLDAKLLKMIRCNACTRARIKEVLMEHADGIPDEVEKQLQSLPKDLDGLYDQILVKSPNSEALKRFLMWLAFASRPLEVEELAEVVTVDFSSDHLPSHNRRLRYDDAKSTLFVCSSFVTEFEGTVKLAHMSMKEYLLSERIKSGNAAFFSVSEALSHSLIAQTCLAYLLNLGKVSDLVESIIQSDFPLAPYAAGHWISHMKLGHCDDSSLSQMTMKIFSSDSNALVNWVRLHDPDQVDPFERDLEKPVERIAASLYYASSYGLQEVVNHLLKTGANVNARSGEYGSALAVASFVGHCSIVRELLENGAEVDAQCKHGTALQIASHQGHDIVVQLLLENGAEVDEQCGSGTALLRASSGGHADVVRQLLNNGADVNSSEGRRCRALWVASYKGHDTVVRLLLEAGADVDSTIHDGDNALHVASYEGHHAVVCLLLNNGCNVNAPAPAQGSALQAASQRGHYAVVRELLKHGASVNTEEGYFGCAIQAASYAGRKDVIQLLLDNGADVNVLGGHYGSALQAAAHKGYYSVARLLLGNGANVHAQGGLHGNALNAAISEKHDQVVELLLNSDATAVQEGCPLHYAAYAGHQEMVQALLDTFADVNAESQNGSHGSALQAASFAGHQAIVRLLLSYGADMNGPVGRHGSALQAASSEGHLEIVVLLLGRSAEVDSPGGQHGSALQAASFGGHSGIVAVLLEHGADVNRLVGQVGSALQVASSKGHVGVVGVLLEHGADVNGPEGPQGSALQAACFGGHSRIVAVLLKHGADVRSLVGRLNTVFHTTFSRGHLEMRHANVLQAVSSAGHLEMVKSFLNRGADYFSTSRTYPHARPFHGAVDNTVDALRLVFAARLGVIPRVLRRLNAVERRGLVVSGAVFVFTVGESRIQRWTDEKAWSPSRIDGDFLVYMELNEKNGRPSPGGSSSSKASSSATYGGYKVGGLIKKASITTWS
ncbi:hypothetical protein HWV62_43632 [Athelia sp. TMB]|nr:hypothetical protein HWV62_43632 [Athelia sp. TMB]